MLVGLLVLAFGVLFMIHALYPEFAVNYTLIWPMLLIVISLQNMIKNRRIDFVSAIVFFIGIIFFFVAADLVPTDLYKIVWPGIWIIGGISIIWESANAKKHFRRRRETNKGSMNYQGVFGGVEEKVNDKDYKGSDLYAIFGGVDLDLRDAELKEESVVINAYSIFGGTTILVPDKYNIVVSSTAILGGNDNKNRNEFKDGRKTIYINCISVFGGAEIK